jgi:hypothetical protein
MEGECTAGFEGWIDWRTSVLYCGDNCSLSI